MASSTQRGWGVAGSGGKEHLFWDRDFSQKPEETCIFPKHIPRRRLFNHKRFPTPIIALIREKATLLFWEYFILVLICLSGAESTQKITANGTYWEGKLKGAGGVARSKQKKDLF